MASPLKARKALESQRKTGRGFSQGCEGVCIFRLTGLLRDFILGF